MLVMELDVVIHRIKVLCQSVKLFPAVLLLIFQKMIAFMVTKEFNVKVLFVCKERLQMIAS